MCCLLCWFGASKLVKLSNVLVRSFLTYRNVELSAVLVPSFEACRVVMFDALVRSFEVLRVVL